MTDTIATIVAELRKFADDAFNSHVSQSFLMRIAERLERIGRGDQWLPIESAPKDGEFLAYSKYGRDRGSISRTNGTEVSSLLASAKYHHEDCYYSHWQPLPPPPQSAPAPATHEWDAVGTRNPPYPEEPPEA